MCLGEIVSRLKFNETTCCPFEIIAQALPKIKRIGQSVGREHHVYPAIVKLVNQFNKSSSGIVVIIVHLGDTAQQ